MGKPIPGKIDKGILRAVDILDKGGIETFESCEGGTGHAYSEPTIRFHGSIAAGWHAVGLCLDNGLPVIHLRRIWDILDGSYPTGPHWEIVFRRKIKP